MHYLIQIIASELTKMVFHLSKLVMGVEQALTRYVVDDF